jgi:hypothetical protein
MSFYNFNFDDMYINKFLNTDDERIKKYLRTTQENALLYNILLNEYNKLNNNYTIVSDDNITLYTYTDIDTNRKDVVYNQLKNLILEQRLLFNTIEKYRNKFQIITQNIIDTNKYNNINNIQPENTDISEFRNKFKMNNTLLSNLNMMIKDTKHINLNDNTIEKNNDILENDNDTHNNDNDNDKVKINISNRINTLRDKFKKKEYFDDNENDNNSMKLHNTNEEISLLNDSSSSITELRQKYRNRKYGLRTDNSSTSSSKITQSVKSSESSKNSKRYSVNRETTSIEDKQSLNDKKPRFKIFNQQN